MAEEKRQSVASSQLPEVVVPTHADLPYLHDPNTDIHDESTKSPPFARRSPVAEYQPYQMSPPLFSSSPSPPGSHSGGSPPLPQDNFQRRPRPPSNQYPEIHSPGFDRFGHTGELSSVRDAESYSEDYYSAAISSVKPVPAAEKPQQPHSPPRRPWYKRWVLILLVLVLIAVIAVALAVGLVFGLKKSHSSSAGDSSSATPNSGSSNASDSLDPGVGGYVSPDFYSKSGAWNGSGIAIAAANPGVDQTLYVYYQDHTGALQYSLMVADGTWRPLGPVDADSYKALNGTPLSVVNHKLEDFLVWHVFYIDSTYTLRERVLTSVMNGTFTPFWTDGPLNRKNLKTNKANKIGMQACYWGDYYGLRASNNKTTTPNSAPSAGIHIWYASSSTAFQQYSWTNGSAEWIFDRTWSDFDGHAGVGCQTWDTESTEYIFFVNTKQEISMYWKDNNQSADSTNTHPVNQWTPVDIGVKSVHMASDLGYTDYMIYQGDDATIRGANVMWAAENTTIAAKNTTQDNGNGDNDGQDTFKIQDVQNGDDIDAVGRTHLGITALATGSGGRMLTAMFQAKGNDISVYTRDRKNVGGLWQAARSPI